jgi:hypothetical protein
MFKLTERKGIIMTTTESGGAETSDSDYGEGEDVKDYSFNNYASTMKNLEGYYSVEDSNRRIRFTNVTRTEVVLVYKSSGLDPTSEQTLIPVVAKMALESYIRKELAYIRNEAIATTEKYSRKFEEEKGKLIAINMPSIFVLEDMFKKETNQTLRK